MCFTVQLYHARYLQELEGKKTPFPVLPNNTKVHLLNLRDSNRKMSYIQQHIFSTFSIVFSVQCDDCSRTVFSEARFARFPLLFNHLTTSSLKLTAILNRHIMYIMISICYQHQTVGAVSDTVIGPKGPPKDNPIWTCHLGLFLMRWVTNNLLNKSSECAMITKSYPRVDPCGPQSNALCYSSTRCSSYNEYRYCCLLSVCASLVPFMTLLQKCYQP